MFCVVIKNYRIMSRLAKKPLIIPDKVEVNVEGSMVKVKGPLGELTLDTKGHVKVDIEGNNLYVRRYSDSKQDKAYHGLYWSLIRNMIEGVTKGFEKRLKLEGVGYRAEVKGQQIKMAVGFSHDVVFIVPPEVSVEYDSKKGHIVLKSIDKQLVGEVAARIRAIRPPEPYKGKGIRYADEVVILKERKGVK